MATAQQTTQSAKRRAREYETIYIMRSAVDPTEADRIAARVREVVERLDGKLLKVDNWGRRKLAYPIQRATRGVFVYLQYVGYEDLVAELERNLRLLDNVLRYQTIILQDHVDPASYEVDPEQVKFLRVESAEEEPEPDLAQRLGLAPVQRNRAAEAAEESEESEGGEDESGGQTGGEATSRGQTGGEATSREQTGGEDASGGQTGGDERG